MEAVWGKKKSWTSHFHVTSSSSDAPNEVNNDASHATEIRKPIVFTQRPTSGKKSPTASFKSSLPSKVRSRGIVYGELEPVPLDSKVDPDWDICFNCWKPGHSHKVCKHPKYYDYCRNCGRRGVNWTNCPRCAKGYRDYQRWRVENNRPEYQERERPVVVKKVVVNEKPDDSVPLDSSTLVSKTNTNGIEPLMTASFFGSKCTSVQRNILENNYFPLIDSKIQNIWAPLNMSMANKSEMEATKDELLELRLPPLIQNAAPGMMNLENDLINQSINGKKSKSNSLGDSIISSEEGECTIYDEDLDGIIIDEQTSSLEPYNNNNIQDFMSLIEIVKHLPIETQNMLVEQFARERRIIENKMKNLQNIIY